MMISPKFRQELVRKSFHLFGLVYAAGFYFYPQSAMKLVIGIFLGVVFFIECARLLFLPVNDWLFACFGGLFRDKERNRFSGVFWMALGMMWLALCASSRDWAVAICLFTIFGDAAASVIGQAVYGPTWWKTKKTIAGSIACFAVCLSVGFLVLDVHWYLIVLSASLATLGEAGILPIDDNFTIPLFASLVMGLG